jgi:hypothetical protein
MLCSSACAASAPAPAPLTSPAPAPASTSASTSASSLEAKSAGPPPSGYYRLVTRVLSDTCTPAAKPVVQDRVMVLAHTTPKGVLLNVPLGTFGVSANARSDIVTEPGATWKNTNKSINCTGADLRTTLVVKDVSRSLVVLSETTEHLDGSSCNPPGPPACTTNVEVRLTLQEARCEASCAVTVDMTTNPPQMKCKCP